MFNKKFNIFGHLNDEDYDYIRKFTLEQRKQKHQQFISQFPTSRIMVVVEKHRNCKISNLQPKVFGIEKTKTLMDFFIIMRTNIGIDKNTSLFIYCNNTIIMNQEGQTVGNLFDRYHNEEDNHLYVKYADFETFGHT